MKQWKSQQSHFPLPNTSGPACNISPRRASSFGGREQGGDKLTLAWNSRWAGKPAGNQEGRCRYVRINLDRSKFLGHALAWKMATGVDPEGEIDHRDNDGSNNAFANLRPASRSQNAQNRKTRVDSQTGLKGANFVPKLGRYKASIVYNGRYYYLGLYDTAEAAHAAYCAKATELHGDFARFR